MGMEDLISTGEWEKIVRRGSNRDKYRTGNGTQAQRPPLSDIANASNGLANGEKREDGSVDIMRQVSKTNEASNNPVGDNNGHTNGHAWDETDNTSGSPQPISETSSHHIMAEALVGNGVSTGQTVNGEAQHGTGSKISAAPDSLHRRRSSSIRKLQEKEKVLKLSPAKMEELMSSPDSIPVRAISDRNDALQQPVNAVRSAPLVKPGPDSQSFHEVRMRRSASDAKFNSMIGSPGIDLRAHLDDPPDFLMSSVNRLGQDSLGNRSQSARYTSNPAPVDRKQLSTSEGDGWTSSTSHPKLDSHRPTHIDLGKKAPNSSWPTDNAPSPMPQSIPLPPLSLPTYLQLELSSNRPSPLYIHHSPTTDFPYESSSVKMERLINFLLLPPALEQIGRAHV